MNRQQFIETLRRGLNRLPKEDKEEIISDYEEHFEMAAENGKSESEIIQGLGDPNVICKQYIADQSIKAVQEDSSYKNVLYAVMTISFLGFLNFIILIGPFIALVSIVFSFYATGVSMVGAGIFGIFGAIYAFIAKHNNLVDTIYMMATCIFITCLGIYVTIGTYYLSKQLIRLLIRYLRWNKKLITRKGGLKDA